MTAISSSTPTKGIAVDSEIQMPPAYDYFSSDSYSDASSLKWLREKEVETPSDSSKTDASSRKRDKISAKKIVIEDSRLSTHPAADTCTDL